MRNALYSPAKIVQFLKQKKKNRTMQTAWIMTGEVAETIMAMRTTSQECLTCFETGVTLFKFLKSWNTPEWFAPRVFTFCVQSTFHAVQFEKMFPGEGLRRIATEVVEHVNGRVKRRMVCTCHACAQQVTIV